MSNLESLGPCTLEGKFVMLEPLRENHTSDLFDAAAKSDFSWFLNPLHSRKDVEERIRGSMELEEKGESYGFAVRLREDNRVVGSTSYLSVVPTYKRAEIGSTWYLTDVWGTTVNPECKYLLLKHAFEDWNAIRIQFITDINNIHSQNAISKLGAKLEGSLRNYGIRPDGSFRESKVYSIISSEWPVVKANLLERLALD